MGHHGAETQVYLPVMVNLNSLKREVTTFRKMLEKNSFYRNFIVTGK